MTIDTATPAQIEEIYYRRLPRRQRQFIEEIVLFHRLSKNVNAPPTILLRLSVDSEDETRENAVAHNNSPEILKHNIKVISNHNIILHAFNKKLTNDKTEILRQRFVKLRHKTNFDYWTTYWDNRSKFWDSVLNFTYKICFDESFVKGQ